MNLFLKQAEPEFAPEEEVKAVTEKLKSFLGRDPQPQEVSTMLGRIANVKDWYSNDQVGLDSALQSFDALKGKENFRGVPLSLEGFGSLAHNIFGLPTSETSFSIGEDSGPLSRVGTMIKKYKRTLSDPSKNTLLNFLNQLPHEELKNLGDEADMKTMYDLFTGQIKDQSVA